MTTLTEEPRTAPRLQATASTAPPSAAPAGTRSEWDPVRFRMSEVPARGIEERRAEQRSWKSAPELPDASRWAASIAKASVECLLGLRPSGQLGRWLDGPVYEALARRADLAVRMLGTSRSPGVRLISTHVQQCEDGAIEATACLHDGRRARAVAVRLEVFHGRWLVTSLEIG